MTAGMVARTTKKNVRLSVCARGVRRANQRAQKAQPITPEESEERDRSAQMHDHQIGEPVWSLQVDLPSSGAAAE